MKKSKLLSVFMAAALSLSCFTAVPLTSQAEEAADAATGVTMYRLYNPNSGEHFYTGSETEKGGLVQKGWKDEGIGWIAPETSNTPVYRLYNPNSGDHHYTLQAGERDFLIGAGWNYESIGWYSDDSKTVPVYREYNPNVVTGTHNYTTSKSEHDNLVSLGWKDEGIGWYAIGEDHNIGDTVVLGSYEQDNDLSNGAEPIEWEVVGIRDGHAVLLSKYVLDNKKYNESEEDITWENCTLRSWLNSDFYKAAFSATDKKRIVTAHNENPDTYEAYTLSNIGTLVFGANGGNATDDKVFFLSWTEAKDYLDGKPYNRNFGESYNPKLLCRPTDYAKARGLGAYNNPEGKYPSDTVGCCGFWLRSPGRYQDFSMYVDYSGTINDSLVDFEIGVRPAILID